MSSESVISVKNVGKSYHIYAQPRDRLKQFLFRGKRQYFREFWALKDVNLDIKQGEVLGIIGRNGAGKSTLLQLLCGTLTSSLGEVVVKGRVAALLELGAGFNPEFTGRENVFMSAAILGLSKQEIESKFNEIVDFSGIRDFIDQPVSTYSSGMYVRLAFSVATSVNPNILIIDEALSVGDGEFARKSFDRIREMKEAGKTILFCSHSLYQVESFCDRVLWLDKGRIKSLGVPAEVVRSYSDYLKISDQEITPPDLSIVQPNGVAVIKGHARLSDITISLEGQSGKVFKIDRKNRDLRVKIQFESDPQLEPPTVGVAINYGTLLTVACVVSLTENILIEVDDVGRGEVIIDFPSLPLRKGVYYVAVYLGSEDGIHIYDHVDVAATLNVEDSLPEPGVVSLDHQWVAMKGHSNFSKRNPKLRREDWQLAKLFTGNDLWVDCADSLGIAESGIYEPVETALLQALIEPGNCVLDIGANLGYYSTLIADWLGGSGVVHAIEPDLDNFELLNENTAKFQQEGLIKLYPLALGDKVGSEKLFRSKDNAGMHRLYDSVCCDGSFTEVEVCRGDDLALMPVDFIKIDIEGYEQFALCGLRNTLNQSPNVKILCEFSPLAMLEAGASPVEWLRIIKSFGFVVIGHNGKEWSPVFYGDLERDLKCLNTLDIDALTRQLKNKDNILIEKVANQHAQDCGYSRPLVENFLLTRLPMLKALINKGVVFEGRT